MNDGSSIDVAEPRIVADSLLGFDKETWDRQRRVYTRSIGVALKDVYGVEQKQTKTNFLMVVGIGFLGLMAIGLVSCANGDGLC